MDIETTSAVKLFFPNPSLILVYFEALANSLDAGATEISITIQLESFDKPETLRVIVSDNGSGFNDDNFDRFKTLLKPRDKFHKGVGRLVFLNYFNRVDISSVWSANRRCFTFKNGFDSNVPIEHLETEQPSRTRLEFSGFAKEKVKAYDDLKAESLKIQIIEHFFPTLQKLKREHINFRIEIKLETAKENVQKSFFSNEAVIIPDDLPDMSKVTIPSNMLDLQGRLLDFASDIEMYYFIKDADGKANLLVAFSVDGRTIPTRLIPQSSLPQGYSCFFFFESDLFHSGTDSSRQKLILPEGINEALLYRTLQKELGRVLNEHIPQISVKNCETQKEFDEKFPHLLGYFEKDTVGIIDRDEALEIAQQRFFRTQKEVLQCEQITDSLYEKSLELSSRILTEYILYRNKIISRLKLMTDDDSEADIHNLIVPRYRDFCQDSLPSEIYQNNAWLLDDKFMVFRTILSEERMDTIINAIKLDEDTDEEPGRPDIAMIFSADPDDKMPVDVVVVEIKKKTSNEKENQYAINQLLDRAVKLTAYCPNIQRIWYYAVIQISDTFATRLRQQKWAPLFSKGKVFYQEFQTERRDGTIVPTPTFAVSFDAIVSDAECRNHTFLEILKHGIKEIADN